MTQQALRERRFVATLALFVVLLGCGGGGEVPAIEEEPNFAPPLSVPPSPAGLATFEFEPIQLNATHDYLDGGEEYHAIGQAFGDYDGDGWLDLYVTNALGPNTLLRNAGDGTFDASPLNSMVAGDERSGGATFVDYDNDGDKDLFVCNWGPNKLFRNTGAGFEDVTATVGLGDDGKGHSAAWGDFDGDGWLDMYVVNWNCDVCANGNLDVLYRSRGDGTFENASDLLTELHRSGMTLATAWVDYDNDGDLDLYVANDKGFEEPDGTMPIRRNVMWRNDGPGAGTPGAPTWTFTEVARSIGAHHPRDSMGIAIGDFDHNGYLDMSYSHAGPTILLSNSNGVFQDVSVPAGIDEHLIGWGTFFADLNLDGHPDLYLAVGGPNRLWLSRGDGTFAESGEVCGLDDAGNSYGCAYADYDRDGDIDVVVGNRGEGYRLYRCRGPSADGAVPNWLRIRLQGAGNVNRDAVGARVTIVQSDGRTQFQEVKCGSGFGACNDLALHFGLGQTTLTSLHVRWPNGSETMHNDIALGTETRIVYGP